MTLLRRIPYPCPRAFAVLVLALVAIAPASRGQGSPRVMQGPMLGAVFPEHVLVWVRVSGEYPVALQHGPAPDRLVTTTPPRTARKDDDYCVVVPLEGLAPGATVHYRVLVNGRVPSYLEDQPPFVARAAPAAESRGRFRVAFGSCARWARDPHQPIWRAIAERQPDLFLWLGDNIYGDALDPMILAEEYRRQRDVPAYRAHMTGIPQLATWDDHDFGSNDSDRTFPGAAGARRAFRHYWPNPAAGLADTPGIFFSYRYGGVDFFFLDDRTHRDPNRDPDGPAKTMLGAGQLAWLKAGLAASRAPFKVLISGSIWPGGANPKPDSWGSFLHERNALFDWIRDHGIGGVILLSGDTHSAELNVIPWSDRGGYDFYDFTSSPLAQEPNNNWIPRAVERRVRLPYDSAPNFGLLEFDLTAEPALTYRLFNTDGRSVWRPFNLRADELVNGRRSWPDKTAPDATRWEATRGTPP